MLAFRFIFCYFTETYYKSRCCQTFGEYCTSVYTESNSSFLTVSLSAGLKTINDIVSGIWNILLKGGKVKLRS